MISGVCVIVGAATIGLAGSAHANPFSTQFQSPSGDISCNLVNYPPDDLHSFAKNFVQCDIFNQSWVPPRPPAAGRADATATVVLMRGQLPIVGYSPGTLAASDPVNYDQPLSAGAISCSPEQSAVKANPSRSNINPAKGTSATSGEPGGSGHRRGNSLRGPKRSAP
jgi:hypothetical protein